METASEGGTNAINATSKPRGTYLDPLKACALSGESGVNIGKSESATYTKYMNIVRQTRRTASRVSVLNDVERSRLSSVMRRIDGEKAYSTAVLDRQKRQFKQSLENLDKHRSGLLRQIDVAAVTPAHLRAKHSQLLTSRKHQLQTLKSARGQSDDGTAADTGRQTPDETLPKQDVVCGASCEAAPQPRTPYALRSRAGLEKIPKTGQSQFGQEDGCSGGNKPIFYTGLGPDKLRVHLGMVHNKKDVLKTKLETDQ